jgi:SAM-dependent methyltransferase
VARHPEAAGMTVPAVIWHDLECGAYREDLPLWRALAAGANGPVLDLGAGTGRVALDLARAGHEVVALDVDADLLAALDERAAGLPVTTVRADARNFDLGRRFGLILAPMQTVQLLEGRHAELVESVARHLAPGGVFAAAMAHPQAYEGPVRPLPDMRERDGWLWSSQPTAIRARPDGMAIERLREVVSPEGERTVTDDVVVLAQVLPDELEACGRAAGLQPLPRHVIPETDEYAGSEVVVLRA